jgi:hypothetical protein
MDEWWEGARQDGWQETFWEPQLRRQKLTRAEQQELLFHLNYGRSRDGNEWVR